ncbi:hypothetical protein ACOSQ3_004679 [Xanthoceras sorbifolium]
MIPNDIISELLCFCLHRSSQGLEILDPLVNRWAKELEVGVLEPKAIKDVDVSFIMYLLILLLQNFILLGELFIFPGKVSFLLLKELAFLASSFSSISLAASSSLQAWASLLAALSSLRSPFFTISLLSVYS